MSYQHRGQRARPRAGSNHHPATRGTPARTPVIAAARVHVPIIAGVSCPSSNLPMDALAARAVSPSSRDAPATDAVPPHPSTDERASPVGSPLPPAFTRFPAPRSTRIPIARAIRLSPQMLRNPPISGSMVWAHSTGHCSLLAPCSQRSWGRSGTGDQIFPRGLDRAFTRQAFTADPAAPQFPCGAPGGVPQRTATCLAPRCSDTAQ